MSVKIILAIIAVVVLLGIGQAWSRYQSKKEALLDINEKVRVAKTKGERELRVPAPIPYYATVSSLDDALGNYSTVIAEPTFVHTRLSSNAERVEAWYKFKIIDFLSEPEKPHLCGSCESVKNVPPEMLPIKEDEVLVVRGAGNLEVDGIKVSYEDLSFPNYHLNQQYLLFAIIDFNSRIASIELGPQGVSLVTSDGELQPIGSASRLTANLKNRFGKADSIKAALKFKKFSLNHNF